MAHEWVDALPKTPASMLMEPKRRCAKCGAEQQIVRYTWYMRTMKLRWEPLVGRCKTMAEIKETRGPGRPKTIKDMRAYKTQKQREYRLRDKLNPSQAKLK